MALKTYKVGIIGKGRGYRSIQVRAKDKASVRREAKRWLEYGSVFAVFDSAREEREWLKIRGY